MAQFKCPECGAVIEHARNPFPTADMLIYSEKQGIVMVKRRNVPHGWALPGGFVEYGERMERAAEREALEETGLNVCIGGLIGVYSDPARDPRMHTVSAAYWALAPDDAKPHGGDDAAEALFFPLSALPEPVVFDHAKIIADFVREWLPRLTASE